LSVVFINPPSKDNRKIMRNFDCATESKANYLYQPYDFLLMSSKVPQEKDFTFIDAVADRLSQNDVLNRVSNKAPRFIVLAVANTNWEGDYQFLQVLRERCKTSIIYVFGDLFLEDFFREKFKPLVSKILSDPFDLNFESEPSLSTQKWAPLYQGSSLKKARQINIPTPRHKDFRNNSYRWPFARHKEYTTVFTSWGCPYSCSYCIMSKFPNLYRKSNEVIKEMQQIHNSGIREIYIGDRSFGLPLTNVIDILDSMIEKKFNFSWSSYFHPNQYNPELLRKMRESGCHTIIVGIESHDQERLKEFGRHMKQSHLQLLLSDCNRLGIDICADFIIGLPGEDEGSILKTIELAKVLPIDYASFNVATPLPGTSVREIAIKNKAFTNEKSDGIDSFGSQEVIGNGVLTGDQILKLKTKAVKDFYFRPKYLLRRLRKVKSPQHLLIQALEGLAILKG
jgi:anaerobic magnesium-protoporphyrin IX monomethyl ester cyclase